MKRDIVRMGIVLLIVITCSCAVPDSRYMEVESQLRSDVVKVIKKQVNKHIEDAKYLVYDREEVCEDIIIEEEEKSAQIDEYEASKVYIGTYRITAYEWTGNPCANGNYPSESYTVACNDLPFGTEVYIDGVGYRVVEDRGGGGDYWMDLYLGDVDACYEWGVQYRDVYVVG